MSKLNTVEDLLKIAREVHTELLTKRELPMEEVIIIAGMIQQTGIMTQCMGATLEYLQEGNK